MSRMIVDWPPSTNSNIGARGPADKGIPNEHKLIVDWPCAERPNKSGKRSSMQRETPSVKFSLSHNQIFYFDMLPSNPESSWYSQSEMKRFKKETIECVRLFNRSRRKSKDISEFETDTNSCRGIEHLIQSEIAKKMIHQQSQLKQAIFSEQKRQEELSIFNPYIIAQISSAHTEWSHKRAQHLGKLYAKETAQL